MSHPILSFIDNLHIIINHYGYAGIFSLLVFGIVGLPVPDETLLTLSGYLIYKGHLHLVPTFLAAYLGSICGISISYAIGKTFGRPFLIKYGKYFHINESGLDKTHKWFEKIGRWTLFIGYFIPGVRHLTAIFAGISELEMWEFGMFAYSGGFIWTATFLSIGYFFGEHWERILISVQRHILSASIIIIIFFLIIFILKIIFSRKKKNQQK